MKGPSDGPKTALAGKKTSRQLEHQQKAPEEGAEEQIETNIRCSPKNNRVKNTRGVFFLDLSFSAVCVQDTPATGMWHMCAGQLECGCFLGMMWLKWMMWMMFVVVFGVGGGCV